MAIDDETTLHNLVSVYGAEEVLRAVQRVRGDAGRIPDGWAVVRDDGECVEVWPHRSAAEFSVATFGPRYTVEPLFLRARSSGEEASGDTRLIEAFERAVWHHVRRRRFAWDYMLVAQLNDDQTTEWRTALIPNTFASLRELLVSIAAPPSPSSPEREPTT